MRLLDAAPPASAAALPGAAEGRLTPRPCPHKPVQDVAALEESVAQLHAKLDALILKRSAGGQQYEDDVNAFQAELDRLLDDQNEFEKAKGINSHTYPDKELRTCHSTPAVLPPRHSSIMRPSRALGPPGAVGTPVVPRPPAVPPPPSGTNSVGLATSARSLRLPPAAVRTASPVTPVATLPGSAQATSRANSWVVPMGVQVVQRPTSFLFVQPQVFVSPRLVPQVVAAPVLPAAASAPELSGPSHRVHSRARAGSKRRVRRERDSWCHNNVCVTP